MTVTVSNMGCGNIVQFRSNIGISQQENHNHYPFYALAFIYLFY